jgi:hypothetical protein
MPRRGPHTFAAQEGLEGVCCSACGVVAVLPHEMTGECPNGPLVVPDELKRRQGKSARRRGHDYERRIVNLVKDQGIHAERIDESGGWHKGDVLIPALAIRGQAKYRKALNIWTALDEAQAHALVGERGVVFFKRPEARGSDFVAQPFTDWLADQAELLALRARSKEAA